MNDRLKLSLTWNILSLSYDQKDSCSIHIAKDKILNNPNHRHGEKEAFGVPVDESSIQADPMEQDWPPS